MVNFLISFNPFKMAKNIILKEMAIVNNPNKK